MDGKLVDLSHKLEREPRGFDRHRARPDGLYVMRHSTAHVLAQALRHLYGAKLQYTIGPVIENGFFYDFEFPKGVSFRAEDLPKVEAEMQKIVAENLTLQPRGGRRRARRRNCFTSRASGSRMRSSTSWPRRARRRCRIYRQGDFTDLCRGPHVPSTGKIKAFKLLSVAGAYWRGDSNREQLTRIYGTAFFDKKQLDEYTNRLEEAKKRDHRVLGPQLGLFTIDDRSARGWCSGSPRARRSGIELQKFIASICAARGTSRSSPRTSAGSELYKTSGHYPYYTRIQFPPLDRPRV